MDFCHTIHTDPHTHIYNCTELNTLLWNSERSKGRSNSSPQLLAVCAKSSDVLAAPGCAAQKLKHETNSPIWSNMTHLTWAEIFKMPIFYMACQTFQNQIDIWYMSSFYIFLYLTLQSNNVLDLVPVPSAPGSPSTFGASAAPLVSVMAPKRAFQCHESAGVEMKMRGIESSQLSNKTSGNSCVVAPVLASVDKVEAFHWRAAQIANKKKCMYIDGPRCAFWKEGGLVKQYGDSSKCPSNPEPNWNR